MNDLTRQYWLVEGQLPTLTDYELAALAGSLVAEFVNRGNDTDTALGIVKGAADGGAIGSREFDTREP